MQMVTEGSESSTSRLIIYETHNKRCPFISGDIKCPYCSKKVCLCIINISGNIMESINDLSSIIEYLYCRK